MPEGGVIADRYRLGRTLGVGTYGHVYEASTSGGHRVAIKILRDELVHNDHERMRFEREASILRTLDHPNIVRVLDAGYTAAGSAFIVFELLEGRTLAADLKRVRFMSATRVAAIARQVLLALGHAHRHGVVHRDIKPGNIHLLRSDHEVDRVKVLDFGVAKPLDEGELERLTDAGAMVGTPGYMAPEQLCAEEVGPTADLFSVGMLMARLLGGQRFVGDTLVEVIRNHMTPGPFDVPRAVVLSELGPVVMRAIEKHPGDRFHTAEEMMHAIEVALYGVSSAPTSASGTVLMPEHLDNELSPNSTVPLEAVLANQPWLDGEVD